MSAEYRMSIAVDASGASSGVDNLAKAFANLEKYLSSMDRTLTGIESALSNTGSTSSKLSGNLDNTAKSANNAQKGMKNAAKSADELADQSEQASKKQKDLADSFEKVALAAGVGFAAMSGVIGLSVKQSMELETAMAGLTKVVDFDTPDGLLNMRREFEKLSTEIPVSTSQLFEMAAAGGQLGVPAEKLKEFTVLTAQMATAFDMTADVAGDSMAKLANIFGKPIETMGEFGDMINTVSNNMPAKASEIVESLSRIGGSAKAFGLAEQEAVALAGSMISLGKAPEVASTAINSMITTLSTLDTKDQDVAQSLKAMGLNAEEFGRTIKEDGYKAIMQLLDGINQLPKDQQIGMVTDLFGKNFGDDILQLAGAPEVLEKINGLLAEQGSYIGSMAKEAANVSGTSASQAQMFANALENASAAFGDSFKPAISAAQEALTPLLEGFTKFAQDNPNLVTGIAAIVTGALGLVAGLGAVVAILPTMAAGWALLSAGMAAVSLSMLGIVAGIAAVIAIGVLLYKNWDTIKAKAIEVWNDIPEYANQAWQWIQGVWGGIGAWFGGIWDSVVSSVHVALVAIKQAFANWLAGMPAPVQEMVANIGSIFSGITAVAKTTFSGITAVAKTTFSAVVAVWQGLSSAVSSAWQVIVGVASSVWDSVKSTVTSAINAIKPIITSVASVFSAAWQGLVAVASSVWSAINAAAMLGIAAIKASLTAGVTGFAVIFNAGFNAVKTVVSTAFNAIKALVRGDIGAVKSAIQNGLSQLAGIARNAISQMVAAFKSAGSQLRNVGGDIIQGLINGLKAKAAAAVSAAREVASSAVNAFKSVFRTASPSRVTREIGEWVSEGLAIGIAKQAPLAAKEAKKAAEAVKKAFNDELASLERSILVNKLKLQGDPNAEFTADVVSGKYGDTKNLDKLYQTKQQALDLEQQVKAMESFDSTIADIQRQIALMGNDNPIKEMMYDFEHKHKYVGYTVEQIQELENQLIALGKAKVNADFASELKKSTDELNKQQYLLNNIGDKYAALRYSLAQKGFDTSQIEHIVGNTQQSDLMAQFEQWDAKNRENALNADPLAKLQADFDAEMALITAFNEQKLLADEEYLQRKQDLEAQHEAQTQALKIAGYESQLALASGLAKDLLGESSRGYKAIFAMEKGMAVARVLMDNKAALAKAWASAPFPQNLPAVGTTLVKTDALASAVNAIRPVIGQAHDGIMSVPKSGTWNLEKGERVLPQHTAKALDDKLDSVGSGGINITINVSSDGSSAVDAQGATQTAKAMADRIKAVVLETLRQERKQGGLLYA